MLCKASSAGCTRRTCDRATTADAARDVGVLFVNRIADLERRFADIAARLHPSGGFWVALPKGRRGTDITEDVVRRIALACGMIDNKIARLVTGPRAPRGCAWGEPRCRRVSRLAPPPISRRRAVAPRRLRGSRLERPRLDQFRPSRARARSNEVARWRCGQALEYCRVMVRCARSPCCCWRCGTSRRG